MYSTHAKQIQSEALIDPKIPKAAVLFASQTIQFPLWSVQAALDSIRQHDKLSPMLRNKNKRTTYEWVKKQKALPITWLKDQNIAEQINFFRTIPGIGTAKAGFLCQLLLGTGGCLDIHNLRKYNLKETQSTKRYIENLNKIGAGVDQLWDDWCHYVYNKDGRFTSPEHVSFVHYTNVIKAKELI